MHDQNNCHVAPFEWQGAKELIVGKRDGESESAHMICEWEANPGKTKGKDVGAQLSEASRLPPSTAAQRPRRCETERATQLSRASKHRKAKKKRTSWEGDGTGKNKGWTLPTKNRVAQRTRARVPLAA